MTQYELGGIKFIIHEGEVYCRYSDVFEVEEEEEEQPEVQVEEKPKPKEPKSKGKAAVAKKHTCKKCGEKGHTAKTCGRPKTQRGRTLAEIDRQSADIDSATKEEIKDLRDQGLTTTEIAERTGYSRALVERVPARAHSGEPRPKEQSKDTSIDLAAKVADLFEAGCSLDEVLLAFPSESTARLSAMYREASKQGNDD